MKTTVPRRAAVNRRPSVAYVLDPRFPGGTSSAIARELETISPEFEPKVYGVSSQMFSGQEPAPPLAQILEKTGTELIWDPVQIQADIVILHNPSFLKFDSRLECQILARKLIVVSHENFERPGGALAFDVSGCLDRIDRASLASEKIIAPISSYNRGTVTGWLKRNPKYCQWCVLDEDWFNICDFELCEPNPLPQDRRGRLSRPGFEKFPSLDALERCFPKSAISNIILGADSLMDQAMTHPHWTLIHFRGMELKNFFESIDFMVYFTSNCLRESFGRVLAEATAAGKVVITDKGTATTIGDGIIDARPDQVDNIIADLIQNPAKYAEQVRRAQRSINRFNPDRFFRFFRTNVSLTKEAGG